VVNLAGDGPQVCKKAWLNCFSDSSGLNEGVVFVWLLVVNLLPYLQVILYICTVMCEIFGRFKIQTGSSTESHLVDGVPVRLADGSHCFVRWKGFCPDGDTRLSGGRRVKIQISAVCRDSGPTLQCWEAVSDQWLLGCLVDDGVYAVLSPIVVDLEGRVHLI
jgi:hypothetical protein